MRKLFYDPREGHFSRGVCLWFAKSAMGLKLKVVYQTSSKRSAKDLGDLVIHGSSKSYLIFETRAGEGHAICTKTVARNNEEIVVILDSLTRYPREITAKDLELGAREWTVYEFVKYDAREKEIEKQENGKVVT